jgi:hypothetical protein
MQEDCIKDNCSISSGALDQGNYGNCWFNAALNSLLLGEYSRILVLDKLKKYLLTNKINPVHYSGESCPLINKKSIMDIIYSTLYLNKFNIDTDYLNSVRFNERILKSRNELLTPLKKYTIDELAKKGIISKQIYIPHGAQSSIGTDRLFDVLGIDYSYVKNNEYPVIIINKIPRAINESITIDGVRYFLNNIALSIRQSKGGHAISLVVCNKKIHYVNSWFGTIKKDILEFTNGIITTDQIKNKDLYLNDDRLFEYLKVPEEDREMTYDFIKEIYKKIKIDYLVYIRENDLKCTSFGKKRKNSDLDKSRDLEYLQSL